MNAIIRPNQFRVDAEVAEWFHLFKHRWPDVDDLHTISMRAPVGTLAIGEADAIMYRIEEETKPFFHRFNKRDRPLLLVSLDGSQVFVAQGSYRFTSNGFEG